LGLASQYKFEYDEAESWYHQSQAILEENRDEETATLVYHELGTVFHARYLFQDAESWYQQALGLAHRLGMGSQMAVEFHYLGLLAKARGLGYEVAQEWFELALEKREELGDRRAAGDECRQLGVLFHEESRLDDAEGWYQRAREIFEEIRDVDRTARTYGQLGKVAEDRGDLPTALEWATRTHGLATEHQLPVLTPAKTHLASLRDKYGEDNFRTWWRGFTGGDPPEDLDEAVAED
jgi:tetratricopeptide (TPR) repeat protein